MTSLPASLADPDVANAAPVARTSNKKTTEGVILMKTKILMQTGALALSLMAGSVLAAVSADEAAKLGKSLTPVGGEKAGNADGSIPEWTGGLKPNAGKADPRGFLDDPYAGEQPEFTITAQNMEQYKDKLTPGQQAMFKRYPQTYKMPVYKTHRSASVPDRVVAATLKNALNTKLVEGGNGLENFAVAHAFPIPKDAKEVIWNHLTRYRGGSVRRQIVQATPQVNGSFNLVYFQDEFTYRENLRDYDPSKPSNVLFFFKQRVTAPSRLAGNVLLVHEPRTAGVLRWSGYCIRRSAYRRQPGHVQRCH
jgi:hypothetical protein